MELNNNMKETINDLMKLKELISKKIDSNHDECAEERSKAENVHTLKYLEGYSKSLTNCKLMVSDAILEIIQSKITDQPE